MLKQSDKILAEGIIKRNVLSQKELDSYIIQIQASDKSLKDLLVQKGIMTEVQVLDVLSEGLGLETIDLKKIQIPKSVIERVPVKFAWYYKFMPIKIETRNLFLASGK